MKTCNPPPVAETESVSEKSENPGRMYVADPDFTALRFQIGIDPDVNHADPACFAPEHPLNPNRNGLHWSWQGGYVFLAIEGDWLKIDGQQSGYSYHLATDRLLGTVELPLPLPLALDPADDRDLRLALDISKMFSSQHRIRIGDDSTSTHSRAGDSLADHLRDNVQHAFTVDSIRAAHPTPITSHGTNKIEIATNATPYPLTLSRYFPQPMLPLDNPLTEEGVELGRRLFHDTSLSINNSQSCASCHRAEAAFTDARRFSLGAEGQAGARNSMPLFNLAWKNSFFWDGRAPTLREQVPGQFKIL
ncbi:MAG: hypothetical protein EXS36_18305 [Pedosphaera sp.]|nr:hypothetical protein [Pedosphaera sp.]